MTDTYHINDTSQIISPGLVLFRDLVSENIANMIRIAGDASRLRPHCKTHKMIEVTQLELEQGITKHKAATFAEAEMLADAGAKDIFLAYNLVGPNINRAIQFLQKYPDVTFSATGDHPQPIQQLADQLQQQNLTMELLLDVDCGLHRTGLPVGDAAKELYRLLVETPHITPGGFHLYDGHQHQESREERETAVRAEWEKVTAFRTEILYDGWPIPRIVAGGTPTFPVYASLTEPELELSPGTCVLNDVGYGSSFQDLKFTPAVIILTRVISRPTANRITLDAGTKSVASDPPMGTRLHFPSLPDAKQVLHNEEHLVLETDRAGEFQPGDELIAIPRHICPTSALHKQMHVVVDGEIIDRWDVIARDRWLTL